MNFVTRSIFELQETTLMTARAVGGLFRGPRYCSETITQMDVIGVGSLTIILLTGFFTGGVMTLQTFPTLAFYGAQGQTGRLVAISLIRELGPVLCALMVCGRVGSAIAAELGSMTASQQIDAMRALGTDPIKKLVAPRLIALIVTLPLLTVVADVVGIGGGGVGAATPHWLSFYNFFNFGLGWLYYDYNICGGVQTYTFVCVLASVACYKGLTTEGGTVGVGRSTTRAVVTASIVVIMADFFLARALQYLLGMPTS